MIFAVFDPSPLTVCINCSFFTIVAILFADLSRLPCHSVQRMFFWEWTQDIKRINQSKSATTGADFANGTVKGSNCVSVLNFVAIGPIVADIWRFFYSSNMAAVRHLGFVMFVRTTHEGHLVVFIAVQGLVGIDAVVLITCMFFDFTIVSWKRLFSCSRPILGFLGILLPKWGALSTRPKAHPCASPRRLSYHARKFINTSDLWIPKKWYK